MVKHTQTIRRLLPTNCLSVFDYFVGLALKGLNGTNFISLVCFCQDYIIRRLQHENEQIAKVKKFLDEKYFIDLCNKIRWHFSFGWKIISYFDIFLYKLMTILS